MLLLLLLSACSEYDVVFKDDNPAPLDSGPQACEPPDLSPGVATIAESCSAAISDLEPVLEWADRSPHDVYNTPVVGQLTDDNGDGVVDDLDVPDIVAVGAEGTALRASMIVMSGDGSGIHWQDDRLGLLLAQPAIGDVNGDGRPDIVAAFYLGGTSYDGYVAYDGGTGRILWTSDNGDHLVDPSLAIIGLYDLEGDGTVEVVLGDMILEGATGELRAIGGLGTGSARPWSHWAQLSIAADLDLDGVQEVLTGNTAYGPDGEVLWNNGELDGAVAVANFDEDPEGEMIAVSFGGEVRLQDSDGSVIWKKRLGEETLGPPSIADTDGDGRPEVAVAGSVWLYSLDADGEELWRHPISAVCSGATGVSAFDFDGDGVVEWVNSDDFNLFILDGPTGEELVRIEEHSHRTGTTYPTIADVDGDGSAEIIVAEALWTGPEQGIQVFGHPRDGWMPARTGWNQHGYGRTQADEVGHVLTAPEPPWLTQNSFRAAELGVSEAGTEPLPDAALQLVDTCACDEGRVRVVVRVANEGHAELPAGVPVVIGLGDNGAWLELGHLETEDPVAPGETTPGLTFTLDAAEMYSETLEVRVGGDALLECDPDDNALRVEVPSCGR